MFPKSIHIKPILFSLILLSLIVTSCENQLPQVYEDQADSQMNTIDNRACCLLSRELVKTDTMVVGIDTSYVTTRYYEPVTAVKPEASLNTIWVNAADSLIQALYDTLITDTTLLISNPDASDTAYCYFSPLGGSAKKYLYLSWDLTEENVDAYIEITIFDKSGQKIHLTSGDMELTTIAGCTEKVVISGQDVTVPKIRARFTSTLTEDACLVRFYISEPANLQTFRMVIL